MKIPHANIASIVSVTFLNLSHFFSLRVPPQEGSTSGGEIRRLNFDTTSYNDLNLTSNLTSNRVETGHQVLIVTLCDQVSQVLGKDIKNFIK